jgi:hypothetical protein
MRAAMSGPDGRNLTASNGKNPHEITKVKTKNVMSGWRLTAATVSLLPPARERRDVSHRHSATSRPPPHPPKASSLNLRLV